jgi:hypothetical protein
MSRINKIIANEGANTFWAGFGTYYLRNVIFGLSTVLVCDYMTATVKK